MNNEPPMNGRHNVKPLIVQSDRTILLEVDNPLFTEARDTLSLFAELEKRIFHRKSKK